MKSLPALTARSFSARSASTFAWFPFIAPMTYFESQRVCSGGFVSAVARNRLYIAASSARLFVEWRAAPAAQQVSDTYQPQPAGPGFVGAAETSVATRIR